jgi:hypothetical protein
VVTESKVTGQVVSDSKVTGKVVTESNVTGQVVTDSKVTGHIRNLNTFCVTRHNEIRVTRHTENISIFIEQIRQK